MDIRFIMNLIKFFSLRYPNIWDEIAKLHAINEREGYDKWPAWCYHPIFMEADIVDGAFIGALAPWRLSKEVFFFDAEFEKLLSNQPVERIPKEVLFRLPYPCIYIKLNETEYTGSQVNGVFVFLNYVTDLKEKEIRFLFIMNDETAMCVALNLDVDTIDEAMEKSYKDAIDAHKIAGLDTDYLNDISPESKEYTWLVNKCLQLVLYICSENADIKAYRPYKTIRTERIRDTEREIRTWSLGEKIGKRIREFKTNNDIIEEMHVIEGTHRSPAPHMRRSHWHHYWTGKKDGSEERVLILKWLDPTLVNGKESNSISEVHVSST